MTGWPRGIWTADGRLEKSCKCPLRLQTAALVLCWPKNQLSGDYAIRYLDQHRTFTEILAENGYECGLSGKWHMGDSFTPQAGFTYWKTTAMGGENYYYPVVLEDGKMVLKENLYVTDWITEQSLNFLTQRNQEKPFYLAVNYTAPHSPWSARNHPKEYIDLYKDCPFHSTPNVPPHPWRPTATKPLHSGTASRTQASVSAEPHTAQFRRRGRSTGRESLTGYYAAITAMDAAVGRLVDRLETEGLLDNTLIIFSGDNGMSMGHHGIWGKGNGTNPVNMYDSAVKVPGIFSLPGTILQGVVNHEMVSHYDFYETILDLAGIAFEKPDNMPGVSFAPLLTGERERVRDSVVVFDEYGPCRMIRTKEWKLVLRLPDGPNELYDLVEDPDEENNLMGHRSCAGVVAELTGELKAWFEKYVDPAFDGSREPVCGRGQLTAHSFL